MLGIIPDFHRRIIVDAGDSTRFSQLWQTRGAFALLVGFESSPVTRSRPDPNHTLPHF
jgi:hypothetical protein